MRQEICNNCFEMRQWYIDRKDKHQRDASAHKRKPNKNKVNSGFYMSKIKFEIIFLKDIQKIKLAIL